MNGVFLGLAGGDAHGNALVNLQTGDGPKQYAINEKAVVTVDDGPVKLGDLKVGDLITLSGQPATTVIATRTYTAPLTEVPEEKGVRRARTGTESPAREGAPVGKDRK